MEHGARGLGYGIGKQQVISVQNLLLAQRSIMKKSIPSGLISFIILQTKY
jgi:hypothetical protein